MHVLSISYPDELLLSLKENESSFNKLAREALFVKLYEMGKISSGTATRILNMSRLRFLDLLSEYNVTIYEPQSKEDLKRDMDNLNAQLYS